MNQEQQAIEFGSATGGVRNDGSVTCLGITFENDKARRAHFTEELRKKLKDPEFRKIEGFPIGEDEDILNLSDPPYYTACPNPWIADFIAEWEAQKPEQPEDYHREPFAADVSEGKNDPIYNAHSYHTKVPHKAIMRYILHYTEPGDIVFDGFCGTGMTGVAAQMCGDRDVVMSLGYQVKPDGTVLQEETDTDGKKEWIPFSKLGARWAVLNDLSPAATFIAYNYNTPVDAVAFEREAKRILKKVEEECGWMYETHYADDITKGKINYTIWSDVFVCPECTSEVVFWFAAVDKRIGKVHNSFPCSHCGAELTKRNMERAWETRYDTAIGETVRQAKQVPVLINYSVEGVKGRFEKTPDEKDLALIKKIDQEKTPFEFPINPVPNGDKTGEPLRIGITHVHHFFYKRVLNILSAFASVSRISLPKALWVVTAVTEGSSKLNRERPSGLPSKLPGTLYVSSMIREINVIDFIGRKILRYHKNAKKLNVISSISMTTNPQILDNSLDYIFLDPPFGSNLNYSELNLLWESWLKVRTNNEPEAIENRTQGKGAKEYRHLMTTCFREAYRILKPGHWMTVEFSNTKASVWNSIQTALTEAGFVVSNVSILDKKQGSYNAVTSNISVKQDLVISAYKPNGGFEKRFFQTVSRQDAGSTEAVWDFVRTHLKYLPTTKRQGALLQFIPERDPRILFDQMVAFYVQKGYLVPISSQEFQIGLAQRFIERDGMVFLPDQAAEYDRKKMTSSELPQMSLFVSDESSAIQWLRQLIKEKPQTFADINPQFMQQLGGWSKNEAQLDLRDLLHQNFLCYDGRGAVPEQIHAYLSSNWKDLRNLPKDDPALIAKARDRWYIPDPNKASNLEKLREKALLKEFEEYNQVKKKLKVFRLEAIRVGFKKAYQERDYDTIIALAKKIPNDVLESDQKLLLFYSQAVTRMGA